MTLIIVVIANTFDFELALYFHDIIISIVNTDNHCMRLCNDQIIVKVLIIYKS